MAAKSGKKDFPKRGEIYWVNLDPAKGNETRKRRPGLVISNNIGNELGSIIQIAPITSKVKNVYPFEVKTTVDGKSAKIMLNQCRAVDKSRLDQKLDQVSADTMRSVEAALRIVFSLN